MRIERVPRVVGLIPDGNRRWARSHGLSFLNGYKEGVQKFLNFAEWCKDYGVRNITVWAFSTENFLRPSTERNALFRIYEQTANDRDMISRLHDSRIRFNVVGNLALLPRDLVHALRRIEVETGGYKDWAINMLIAYGGKDDILHATKQVVKHVIRSGVRNVSETLFRSYMFSSHVPDMDLVIRTSGEERLSGFMPWQSIYSEFYFSKKLWPDFTKKDLEKALISYDRRQRRFGT